jgi:hypothetical protein
VVATSRVQTEASKDIRRDSVRYRSRMSGSQVYSNAEFTANLGLPNDSVVRGSLELRKAHGIDSVRIIHYGNMWLVTKMSTLSLPNQGEWVAQPMQPLDLPDVLDAGKAAKYLGTTDRTFADQLVDYTEMNGRSSNWHLAEPITQFPAISIPGNPQKTQWKILRSDLEKLLGGPLYLWSDEPSGKENEEVPQQLMFEEAPTEIAIVTQERSDHELLDGIYQETVRTRQAIESFLALWHAPEVVQ